MRFHQFVFLFKQQIFKQAFLSKLQLINSNVGTTILIRCYQTDYRTDKAKAVGWCWCSFPRETQCSLLGNRRFLTKHQLQFEGLSSEYLHCLSQHWSSHVSSFLFVLLYRTNSPIYNVYYISSFLYRNFLHIYSALD